MTNSFVVGGIVKLKSGGPSMTVTHINDDNNMVTCHWFERGELKIGYYHVDCLLRLLDR
jgi:uncharacterized protein YodC (DUF2158 family)